MGEIEKLKKELKALESEHKQLESEIGHITQSSVYDQLKVQRLKRRKLFLKDRIEKLREFIYDDIIA